MTSGVFASSTLGTIWNGSSSLGSWRGGGGTMNPIGGGKFSKVLLLMRMSNPVLGKTTAGAMEIGGGVGVVGRWEDRGTVTTAVKNSRGGSVVVIPSLAGLSSDGVG